MATAVDYSEIGKIIQAFGRMPSEVGPSVRAELEPVWRDMARSLAIYPAPPTNSTYERSGDLGRGWVNARPQYVVSPGGGVSGRLTNPVGYTDYVQGDEQTLIHSGRWTKASVVLTEFEQDITVAVERGVMQAARKVGLD